MNVKIKKLHSDAVVPYKTHQEDFCYDVVATSCEEIAPNVYKYGTGLAFEIDREEMAKYELRDIGGKVLDILEFEDPYNKLSEAHLSIDFRPRSSIWKTGMILSNSTGTIDEPYRGEVCAVFYHVIPNMPKYEVGDSIGQIKLGFTLPMKFIETEELSDTERGNGGFGSTGK